MTLKIIGVGMPRTGTASLCEALRILGYNAIHHAPERIDLDTVNEKTFDGLYDDVDAVLDMPAALFADLIVDESTKVILTTRDEHDWWESIKHHTNKIRASANIAHIRYTDRLHQIIFGTAEPHEFLWRRRFRHWIQAWHPLLDGDERFGVLDVCREAPDRLWRQLCDFLDKPIPSEPFPWKNRKSGDEPKS